MMQTENRNNGDGDYVGPMDAALPFHMGADVAKYFVEAGKSVLDLLMRCNFRSDRERKAYLADIDYCTEYGIKDGMVEVFTHLASSDSNNSERIERFLAGITAGASRNGQHNPEKRGIFDLGKYSKPKNQGNNDGFNPQ